ncbi:MAG: cytochrome b [Alphaproteobacteria bacterium]|nr:cytochrome b [Alphaproteobacteria bacterium]
MQLRDSDRTWGWVTRLFHWTMAGIIFFMLGLGVYMAYFVTDPLEQFPLVQLHKSWGFLVFGLAVLRVVWRLGNRRKPALPDAMSAPEKLAARLGHLGLYVLILAMPISGWLMASASPLQDTFGVKNKFFGLFEVYDPFKPGGKELADFFGDVHFYCAIALTALLIVHIAAALRHQFVKRDDILKRMTYGA